MGTNIKPKIICIHLPQYHQIKENDEWWGKGFTEWTNVKKGRALYPGHYQPRVPYNYYDLSDLSQLEDQIRMARKTGVFAFSFYHYYSKGRKLLEFPIESYRDNSKEDFPYCLIWANHSWLRTWYGFNNELLLKQEYGHEKEWVEHFNYLNTFFKDKRYIKIENKPVYIIYLAQDIECREEMFSLWNSLAKQNGFDGIYLISMITGFGYDHRYNLYNAYMNFEPMHFMASDTSYRHQFLERRLEFTDRISDKKSIRNALYALNTYTYKYITNSIEKRKDSYPIKCYQGAFSGWDNVARKERNGWIVPGSNPKRFGKHIANMLKKSYESGDEYLFINAWNEWSEGAYIEPDEKYGDTYLLELKKSVDNFEREIKCGL